MAVDGQPSPVIQVPPSAPITDLPSIPDWLPPIDTGQPSAQDLNELGTLPKENVAARHSIIPITYGRDRLFGRPICVTVDDAGGSLYIAYAFCEGEIAGFEQLFVDSGDRVATGQAFQGLKNRGFETGTNYGWTSPEAQNGTVNNTVSRTGNWGMNIPCAAGGPNHFSDRLKAPPEGIRVRIQGYVQRNSSPDADAVISIRHATTVGGALTNAASGEYIIEGSDTGRTADDATAGWQFLDFQWEVPAGIVEYVIDLGESDGTTGSWDFDDISTQILQSDNLTASAITTDSIEYVLYRGEPGQNFDSMLANQLTGYDDVNAGLAYVVLRAPAGSTSGFPRLEAIIQGKKVYDPRAYNILYDNKGDPFFANGDDADETTAQWFTDPNEAFSIEADGSWTVETADPAPVGTTYIERIDNDDAGENIFSKEVVVDPNKDYTVTCYVKQPSGDRQNYLLVGFWDENGNIINNSSSPVSDATGWAGIGTYHYYENNITFPTGWTQYQFDFGPSAGADGTIPTGAKYMRIGGLFTRNGAVGTNTTVRITDMRVFEGLKEVEQVEGDATTHLYTQNPAICFRDMVTNHTTWDVFEEGIGDLANYNDELVSGVTRRAIGLTLARPQKIDQWVKGFRTYMGGFVGWEAGKIRVIPNRADVIAQGVATFDGANNTGIEVADDPVLDFDNGDDFTLEVWFRPASAQEGSSGAIVGKKASFTTNSNQGYSMHLNSSDQLVLRIGDGTNFAQIIDSTTDFYDGEWHYAAISQNWTTDIMTVNVNGASQTVSTAGVTGNLTNALKFTMGITDSGLTEWDGEIDEVRLWDTAKSVSDLNDARNAEIDDPKREPNLVGYWRLNDGVGATTAVDETSNGNDGTLQGGAAFAFGHAQLIPENVAMHITADDIVRDSLDITRRSLREVPNVVAVDYEDGSGIKWHTERVRKESPRVTSELERPRLSRISLPGIHNASQAQREATERLNWYLTDLDCTVGLFDEGWMLQQGSIVCITHPIGLDAKLMRVTRLTAQSGRWVVDMSEYDPAMYSDEVVADPTTPDTNLGSPLNPPTISNLTLAEELFTYKNGNTGSRVRIDFDGVSYPFLSQYLVEGYVDGTKVWQTETQSTSVVTPPVEELVTLAAVDYEVRVYVQSPFAIGAAATQMTSILGKLAAPGNVPTISLTQISADQVRVTWGAATDIDIWRYEVRIGTTSDAWEDATSLDFVDGLTYQAEGLAVGTHRFFVKAIDSVRNESVAAIQSDISLGVPPAVSTVSGFEVASEVRLNWPAPSSGFVERYRIAYDTVPASSEVDLDIVDTLRFQTKDVPEGTWQFLVYSRDRNGVEATTAPSIEIEVTSDADAFLADEYNFVTPSLTNMVQYDLRLDTRDLYVTNMGDAFSSSPSDFDTYSGEALANYHSAGASEWLSETQDFGLLLTGSWNLTQDVVSLNGTVTVELELSTDDVSYTKFTGAAKGEYRYARVRVSTSATPGTATAFVKSPIMNLKINVVPLEESGEATSNGTEGNPHTVQLAREYTSLKEVLTQVKNNIDGLYSIVDNIIIGPNTGIRGDDDNFIQGGDFALCDPGTGDFTVECWAKNDETNTNGVLVSKRNSSTATGWELLQLASEEVRFTLDDGTVDLDITTTGNAFPEDGNWHHISARIDRTNDTCIIRIDGTDIITGDISTLTGSVSNSDNLCLLARNNDSGHFSGDLDEVRYWSVERTTAQIDDNRQIEIAAQANLEGYWRCDGAVGVAVGTSGGDIDDASGNGYDMDANAGTGIVFIDPGATGNNIQKINSFDVYVFDTFGQQLAEEFQWRWKAV